ncbi:LPXTG cell wall anchor domain-containing protein [Enterococcus ureilyticus]
MGDEIYQSISILGILMILFSGGIFLIRKKS